MRKNIVIIKQSSEKDCGPACLLSIIKYYGGHVPLETVKLDCKISNEGTNFYDILKAANRYGFDGCGYELSKEKIYSDNRIFPAICQIIVRGLKHFIVIYKIDKSNAIIMDPAYGKKTISINEFFEIWSGLILELYPKSNILIINSENKIFDIVCNVFVKERKIFFKLFISGLALIIASIISNYYLKISIDNINSDIAIIKYSVILFFIILIFKSSLYYIKNYYEIYLNKNVNVYFYQDFFNHLFNLPSKIISIKPVGELITRFNDLTSIKTVLIDVIVSFFLDFLLMLCIVPILIMYNFKLFIIFFVTLVLYLIIGLLFSRIIFNKIIQNKEYETEFSTVFTENILLYRNIKNLNKSNEILYKINRKLSLFLYDNFILEKINNYHVSIKYFVNELGLFLINAIGILEIINKNITISELIIFNSFVMLIFEPIKNLLNNIPKYNYIKASLFRLNEFMAIKEENVGHVQNIDDYSIKIENLNFGYNDFDFVLKNKNIEIGENSFVLFSGTSGCGKSTICKLLLKEETNYNGNIYLGNHNIKDLSLCTIRKNILYVTQNEKIFTGTIKENIEFLRDVDFSDLEKVSKICELDNVISKKILRYETLLTSDYSCLSGGEKQKLVLARSLLNDFNVLIIDEALSEVDVKTEIKIIKNLEKYFKNKILIYISHKDLKKHFKKVINFD